MKKTMAAALLAALMLTGCGKEEPKLQVTVPVLTEAPETVPVTQAATLPPETQAPTETVPQTSETTVPEREAPETVPAETEPPAILGKVVKTPTLKVREGPSVNTKVMKELKKDDVVTILEGIVLDSVQWAHIDGGWACLDYLAVSGPVPVPRGLEPGGMPGVVYHTDTLNVRSEPSGGAEKTAELVRNDVVVIYEIQNGWGRMDQGWVSMEYIQLQKDNAVLSATGGDWVPEHTPESDLHDFTAPSEGIYMDNPVDDYFDP